MYFAIKHDRPMFYLQKGEWNWTNVLDERTVYTGREVADRLMRIGTKDILGEAQIVPLKMVVIPAQMIPAQIKYEEIA